MCRQDSLDCSLLDGGESVEIWRSPDRENPRTELRPILRVGVIQ